ncbi:putative bifunctional lysylphosphatidylglycerol flippase/synthetase [Sandaracinobacteroides hominis]|uniref:lysylphosphatidylglycerol synthase domain-containing protein n=1 Tax=Sandaracinobacteroides hominis TaxID=2780086 RepID=UPI0018F41D75|nr:lysylphosphatidylglycerol synthase domain-containing protein [Sandaracinobacteroides hominis]
MKLDPRLERLIGWVRVHQTWLTMLLMAVVLGFASLALLEILRDIRVEDVLAAFGRITPHQILLSIGLTALSFFVLSFYDVLGLHAIGKPQRYWRAALGSFTAYNLSHNLGFAPITGAAARWRAYRGTNLDAADIARLVVIAGVTFWLGIFLMLGAFLIAFPGALRVHDNSLPYYSQAAIGAVVLAGIGGYLVACARQTGPINILGWTLPVPTLKQALIQFSLAATDIAIASAALLVLLPSETWFHYPDFLVAYVVAVVVALLTHAPGGIGVFEAVILVTLPEVDKPSLVSALILYRMIYYWGPLLLALMLLGLNELRLLRNPPVQEGDRDERIVSSDIL